MRGFLVFLLLVTPLHAKQFSDYPDVEAARPSKPLQRFAVEVPCLERPDQRRQATWTIKNMRTGEIVKRSGDRWHC